MSIASRICKTQQFQTDGMLHHSSFLLTKLLHPQRPDVIQNRLGEICLAHIHIFLGGRVSSELIRNDSARDRNRGPPIEPPSSLLWDCYYCDHHFSKSRQGTGGGFYFDQSIILTTFEWIKWYDLSRCSRTQFGGGAMECTCIIFRKNTWLLYKNNFFSLWLFDSRSRSSPTMHSFIHW